MRTEKAMRFLSHNYQKTPHQMFEELARAARPEVIADSYGEGDLITSFESEIANLLGKEAAVFMPSGTMAQQIALRIWTDKCGTKNVAFHPTCHLEIHENKGYEFLHGMRGVLVGSASQLMTLSDLHKVSEPLGALLLELPQREIGGVLPKWEELTQMVDWAKRKGIRTHMDGARLWECKPFYQREYSEIASLFDSVYVSFYKALGGIAGAVLAGPEDFIEESRIWQKRHGGNLIHMYPFVLSAKLGLTERLGKIQAYHEKAVCIASTLRQFSEIELVPDPPHTNMMHVYIRGEKANLEKAALDIVKESGVVLFEKLRPSAMPVYSSFELTVGDASLDLQDDEISDLFLDLLKRAKVVC